MSADRDLTRIVRSWLKEDAYEDADRILDLVLDQLETTPQRRAGWLARRFRVMNTAVKFGLAAAVMVVGAIIGFTYLIGPNAGGPVEPTPTAIPTPSPTPLRAPATGSLEPGTYLITSFTRRAFTVTVPDGWYRESEFIAKGDGPVEISAFEGNGVTMATWVVSHVYQDSCRWEGTLREVASAGELVDALVQQAGHETSGPTGATVGGAPATRVELSVSPDFDITTCDNDFMRLWPDAGPDENFGLPIFLGQTTTVYVVDADAGPMVVVAIRDATSLASDVSELEQVIASIRFEP